MKSSTSFALSAIVSQQLWCWLVKGGREVRDKKKVNTGDGFDVDWSWLHVATQIVDLIRGDTVVDNGWSAVSAFS